MKKLFLFLLPVILCSCNCKLVLSQIPPQSLQADDNCQAILPDYTKLITVKVNCGTITKVQTPAAGYILTVANKVVDVTIKVTDVFNQSSSVTFPVTLINKIPPVIIPDSSLLVMNEPTQDMLNSSQCIATIKTEDFDAKFPYEYFGLTKPDIEDEYVSIYYYPGNTETGEAENYWTLR